MRLSGFGSRHKTGLALYNGRTDPLRPRLTTDHLSLKTAHGHRRLPQTHPEPALVPGADSSRRTCAFQGGADARPRSAARPTPRPAAGERRRLRSLHPPGGSHRETARRQERHRRHPRRQRQEYVLQPARSGIASRRPDGASAISVPNEGAGARPRKETGRAHAGGRKRARRQTRHLRRGYPPPGQSRYPPKLQHRHNQPGYVAPGDPAQPSRLVSNAARAEVRRAGRGARISRRLRDTRGERSQKAQAAVSAGGQQSAVHTLLGDDSQPRRTRREAGRAAVRGSGGRRLALRRQGLRALESADD